MGTLGMWQVRQSLLGFTLQTVAEVFAPEAAEWHERHFCS